MRCGADRLSRIPPERTLAKLLVPTGCWSQSMWEPNAAQTAGTVEQTTSCMTDQVYLSQHPDGQAKISLTGFSAEPEQKWIAHRLSSVWAIFSFSPRDPTWAVASVKDQRVQDCKSKPMHLWITHPEGILVRGFFGKPHRNESEERVLQLPAHRLFIQPNQGINNVYKVQGETINSGNTAMKETFQ